MESTEAQAAAADGEEVVRRPVVRLGVGRGLAIFFGAFGVLNGVGELVSRGFDANVWWMDLGGMPVGFARVVVFVASALLLAGGVWPRRNKWLAAAGEVAALWVYYLKGIQTTDERRGTRMRSHGQDARVTGVSTGGPPVPRAEVARIGGGGELWG